MEKLFAGTQVLVAGEEGGKLGVLEPFPFSFPNLGWNRFTVLGALPACLFPLHWMPCFLSFISSETEDWGYLNEDGELGLAYQGLKQVARSNICLSSCVCHVCSACSCLCLIVFQLAWM